MSQPPYSFVIPVLNEAGRVRELLLALRRRFPDAELIVVDGGSADSTAAQAAPHCDRLLHSPAGRARQMNCGAREARGRYLFFLHVDSCPGVEAPRLAAYLASAPLWGFSRVQLSGERHAFRVISAFINWRSRLTGIGTGDQMLFIRRDALHGAVCFDDIPLMEDVAFCKRMRRQGPPLVLAEPVLTSSRRWQEHGVVRTVLTMWALRLAYALGTPPERLWRIYYGS
ncbi:TIGR04283 family arsenosugar biosynthesis glycosyltransferase [Pseudohalioglobus sediminis]|uniref:TIGR04283 family arsenosugar biosynthesis glycosyltransferase n=1 Tax=Pseudohalioglobus sediminis TaxID=2606449 RepID=UPI00165EF1E9|nr:TIGR04283 family arsenosugar biosynthesis glycosyltransferase [Pseudohalioglobus sediminis]